MTICITSQGSTLDDPLEARFGRSPWFLFVDEESGDVTAVENPYATGAGGVGPRSVQLVADHGATALITGQLGGNALVAIKTAGIPVFRHPGGVSAGQALEEYRAGKLVQLD